MFKAYDIEIIFKLLAVRERFLFIFVTSWAILKLQVVWGSYEPQVTWGKNELLLKAQPKERWVHSLWNCSLAFSFTRRHGLRDIFTGIKLECSLLIPECSKKQKENHQEKKMCLKGSQDQKGHWVNADILFPDPDCLELCGLSGPWFKLLRDGHNDTWDLGSPHLEERIGESELCEE